MATPSVTLTTVPAIANVVMFADVQDQNVGLELTRDLDRGRYRLLRVTGAVDCDKNVLEHFFHLNSR